MSVRMWTCGCPRNHVLDGEWGPGSFDTNGHFKPDTSWAKDASSHHARRTQPIARTRGVTPWRAMRAVAIFTVATCLSKYRKFIGPKCWLVVTMVLSGITKVQRTRTRVLLGSYAYASRASPVSYLTCWSACPFFSSNSWNSYRDQCSTVSSSISPSPGHGGGVCCHHWGTQGAESAITGRSLLSSLGTGAEPAIITRARGRILLSRGQSLRPSLGTEAEYDIITRTRGRSLL